jgi:hypothetical protein
MENIHIANRDRDPDLHFFTNEVTSMYYDTNSFNSAHVDTNNFLLVHHNIRSFCKNFDELGAFLDELNKDIDVLVLSETWFCSDNYQSIEGYTGYHCCRQNRRGGGISIFVREQLTSTEITSMSVSTNLYESCVVKISVSPGLTIKVVGLYRPPDKALMIDFTHAWSEEVLGHFSSSDVVFIAGDFNIDLLQPVASEKNFIDVMRSSFFIPLITKPTHVSDNRASIIDHIWTNATVEVKSGIFPSDVTDHYPIFALFSLCVRGKPIVKKFRDHAPDNLALLKRRFHEFSNNFSVYNYLDLDTQTRLLLTELYKIYDQCCPIRSKTISAKKLKKPWISNALMTLIHEKHSLYNQFRRGLVPREHYNVQKNVCCNELRAAKLNYFRTKFEQSMGDIRLTWKNLNFFLKPNKTRESVPVLEVGDRVLTDDLEVADTFNEYFASVAQKLDAAVPQSNRSPLDYLGDPVCNTFFAAPCIDSEAREIIMCLPNKGCHITEIPTYIYKLLADDLSSIISYLFNRSLQDSAYPTCLKLARITPIFKSGDKKSVENYRPISCLPTLSKVFEKLMNKRLVNFLDKYKILSKHQFGFRSGSSTSDAVLQFLDFAYESLNRSDYLIGNFLDFSKAFDTVNHTILLEKMNKLGFRGATNDWFRSYLFGRRHFVRVGKGTSKCADVQMGVPQGSVLGPVLFLLYINDMSTSSNHLQYVHFADDTTVFISGNDFGDTVRRVNGELDAVDEWLKANRLSLNVNKTAYMTISNRPIDPQVCVELRGTALSRVTSANFLGLIIDDKLTFKPHIDLLVGKLCKSIGIMRKIAPFVPCSVLRNLYFSLIYPYIMYGIAAWGGCGSTQLNRVKSIQSRALSLFPGNKEEKCKINRLLNIDDIYNYFVLVKFYKCYVAGMHEHFFVKILSNKPSHSYSTRFRDNNMINLPSFSKSKCQSSFIFKGTALWNALPIHLKEIKTLSPFKKRLMDYLLSK